MVVFRDFLFGVSGFRVGCSGYMIWAEDARSV